MIPQSRRKLPILSGDPSSNDEPFGDREGWCVADDGYLSDAEIALALEMRRVKLEMREARTLADTARFQSLRSMFDALRAKLEVARRVRLDSLGWIHYD